MRVGGSTGTNLWGAFEIVAQMRQSRTRGSVVTLLCDGGERYANTYYDDTWVAAQGLHLDPCGSAELKGVPGRWDLYDAG